MSSDHFVDEARLTQLAELPPVQWDLTRLIRLCEELNESFRNRSLHAVTALTRALLDHVPPIFGCRTFSEVANNYAGGRSFRETMKFLNGSARKIADAHLHSQIRDSEVLPTVTQVDVRPAVDLLLAEIIRISKIASNRLAQMEYVVARAQDLMADLLCPTCGAPIERKEPGFGTISNEWGDYDVEWEEVLYECGRETYDGEETRPCGHSRTP